MYLTQGDRIRGRRAEQRLSQVELARRAGLNPKTICLIETGQSGGMHASLRRIADALGVSLDDLKPGEPT